MQAEDTVYVALYALFVYVHVIAWVRPVQVLTTVAPNAGVQP